MLSVSLLEISKVIGHEALLVAFIALHCLILHAYHSLQMGEVFRAVMHGILKQISIFISFTREPHLREKYGYIIVIGHVPACMKNF